MATTLAAHQVKVTIVEAQGLARTNDWNEGSDSFCEIKVHGKSEGTPHKTSVQKQTLSPKWNETFIVELSHSPMNDTLEIFVWGDKLIGKLFVGRVEIPVTLLLHGAMVDGWFKLLPQSLADLGKTVVGHLHLILHYSQVQVPAPVKPEKSATSTKKSSTSYPGATPVSSIVNCPICSRPFSSLTINQHLDLCTQASSAKTSSRAEVGACPVCCKTFPLPELDKHVENCLASQPAEKEPKRTHTKSIPRPTSESEEDAQLQAVLIASKLEAERKKGQDKEQEKSADSSTGEGTPAPNLAPFYPSLPYIPYPAPISTGMPMGVPPTPFTSPYPVPQYPSEPQHPVPVPEGQGQLPSMYYLPPMYPPFYPPMGAPVPSTAQPAYPTTPSTTSQPKTDLLF